MKGGPTNAFGWKNQFGVIFEVSSGTVLRLTGPLRDGNDGGGNTQERLLLHTLNFSAELPEEVLVFRRKAFHDALVVRTAADLLDKAVLGLVDVQPLRPSWEPLHFKLHRVAESVQVQETGRRVDLRVSVSKQWYAKNA